MTFESTTDTVETAVTENQEMQASETAQQPPAEPTVASEASELVMAESIEVAQVPAVEPVEAAEAAAIENTSSEMTPDDDVEPVQVSNVEPESESPVADVAHQTIGEAMLAADAKVLPAVVQPEIAQAAVPQQTSRPPRAGGRGRNSKPQRAVESKPQSYKPEDIFKNLQQHPKQLKEYLRTARRLYTQIRQAGLGTALAVLLADHRNKSATRLYWDLTKWVLKEQRIKGKNSRSLLESVVYSDTWFLARATSAVLTYLDMFVQLAESPSQPSESRSSDA